MQVWSACSARHIHPKLAERAYKRIEKQTRTLTERDPKQAAADTHPRQAVEIVQKARRRQWVKLRQDDDFPAVPFDCAIQDSKSAVVGKKPFDSLAAYFSGNQEGESRPEEVPGQNQEEAPPQTKKEASAHTEDAPWKQQQVTKRVGDWVDDAAPETEVLDRFPRIPDPVDDRIFCGCDEQSDQSQDQAAALNNQGPRNPMISYGRTVRARRWCHMQEKV